MASKRRGGFGTPELRGTLGTLLRTTTDVVRGALERGAREGRARLDDARIGRRRQDALADLGGLVLDLIRRGEIDLGELPEARDLVQRLDELDDDRDDDRPPPRAGLRHRYDDRARATGDDHVPSRFATNEEDEPHRFAALDDDRAPRPSRIGGRDAARTARVADPADDTSPGRFVPRADDTAPGRVTRRADDDRSGGIARRAAEPAGHIASRPPIGGDGTVSSGAMRSASTIPRAETHSSRAPTQPLKTMERAAVAALDPIEPAAPPAPRPYAPGRPGGITFDDDDLADYMHPDDVPAKNPGDGEA